MHFHLNKLASEMNYCVTIGPFHVFRKGTSADIFACYVKVKRFKYDEIYCISVKGEERLTWYTEKKMIEGYCVIVPNKCSGRDRRTGHFS